MSNTNDKRYYVDFGPELLQLLGPNLYTNIYYVLGEIIANAYDADAENVYIIYDTSANSIIIEDDGTGMTYKDINNKFLPIGVQSRVSDEDTFTPLKHRKKMGRKGIGKLAALSVSKRIQVTSVRNGEKSGCILSLDISKPNAEGRYEIPAIDDNEINFRHIKDHGSAIIMENARYSIHKSIESAKRNISLIFPFACKEFKIHLENLLTKESTVIDGDINDIIKLSDTLITFTQPGSKYSEYLSGLHESFDSGRYYRALQKDLSIKDLPVQKVLNKKENAFGFSSLKLINNDGEEQEYELLIEGWIATYASTKDKKKSDDFPVNHISIISHDKLGQFDILADISTDRMQEAYVVGQFFVDLLEETSLPDISASNRQGYKTDDIRFIKTKELIREFALKKILDLKKDASEEKNFLKNKQKQQDDKTKKEEYNKAVAKLLSDKNIAKAMKRKRVRETFEKAYELKRIINSTSRKLLISHNSVPDDIGLINIFEKILLDCGFTSEEILYTSSSYYESRIPGAYTNIYDYLQDFFLNTVKRNDLCVVYILNKGFITKWNPTLEAGAGWVLSTSWFPIYTDDHTSVCAPFEKTLLPCLKYHMPDVEVRYLASAIKGICDCCGKKEQTEDSIVELIKASALTD